MQLAELRNTNVALLGLGADVMAALDAIREVEPADICVVDDGPLEDAHGLRQVSLDEAAGWADVFVRAPGYPRYREPLLAALERGAEMTTPLDLWLGTVGPNRTVVGITGTKGKSTVSELVGRLAPTLGLRVGVAGNLGPAVFGTSWDVDAPIVALEVSSYQAADVHHVPDIVAVTYLAEDHLSWHGGRDAYVADKLRLLRNAGGTAPTILVAERAGRALEAITAMGLEPDVIVAPAAEAELPAHRVQNAALAAEVLHRLGAARLSDTEVLEAARTSLPGRLDRCEGPADVLCIDDALASNPSATAAALAWLRGLGRSTVVLLGGSERGVDLAPLAQEVQLWPEGLLRAVTLPDTGPSLAEQVRVVVVGHAETVTEAVALALADALGSGRKDSAVLFSPAASTPSRLGNWQNRSEDFRAALVAV